MAVRITELFRREKKTHEGLLNIEWVALGYIAFTLLMMGLLWDKLPNTTTMLGGRIRFVLVTLAMWAVYRLWPCRLTYLGRIAVQLLFLSWSYPDTYELNRVLPNLDHVFAGMEQHLFGCQPALLFSQHVAWPWFSELMCLGYVSYFPLMVLVVIYYFWQRYAETGLATFVLLSSFYAYYVIFVLLPVTGPQFYYLAAGTENIAAGIFPNLGDWFLTHSERMAPPGWTDGFFYHLLESAHEAGERPTAAFPSSHVGITTVLMLLALRTRSKRLCLTVLPFYVTMCFATVYIRAHYAVDVAAGLLTGIVFYYALCGIYKKMGLR